jgi:phospholipase/carboxylesterase
MNRIQSFSSAGGGMSFSETAAPSLHVGSGKFSPASEETPVALFAPLHYEANYAYPLVVWLHGPSDDESQLKRIMPLVSMRNYVAAAPRGTSRADRAAGKPGYRWSQNHAELASAEQRVFDAIDLACKRFHVAPRRIFLAGFDCGGTMAFRLAMDHPRRFGGALSLGGEFPAGRGALRSLAEARRVPIFLACGRDSLQYPTQTVCENLKLFHSAGLHVSLRQYPCGHELTAAMLADVDRWIMEQVTSPGRPAANPH